MILSLLLILAVVTTIRVRLLDMPLERDEGEFAYAGQLLLQDVSPYKAAYNVALKLPGTSVAYALIMAAFGQTVTAIHAGVMLVNLATAVLVFVLARRIGGEAAGVVAAGTYALLSIVPETLGLAAHATHLVLLPALAGVVLLQNLDDRTSAARIFSAGWLIGLAVLMKQSGAAFGLFAAGWILWCEFSSGQKQWPRLATRLGWLALGGLLPFFLMCFIIVRAGDFRQFWFWTFQYARPARHDFHFGTWHPMDVQQTSAGSSWRPPDYGVRRFWVWFCFLATADCNAGGFSSSVFPSFRSCRFVRAGISADIISFN